MSESDYYLEEEYLDEFTDFTPEKKTFETKPPDQNVDSSLNTGWTKHATMTLLSLYEVNSHIVENPRKKTKIWTIIARGLHEFGIEKSPDQVRWKMNALKKKYKECIDNNGKSGRGHMTFEYYDILEDIFQTGKKAATTYTISSKAGIFTEPQKKTKSGITNENDPANTIQSKSPSKTLGLQRSNEKPPRKKLTRTNKQELEDQLLSHLKRVNENRELGDERFKKNKKMRTESFRLKQHQISIRERQIDVAERIAAKKLKSKEKRHEELLEMEQYKCKILEQLLNKP